MISWTIPADKTTTGHTVFTASSSGITSLSGTDDVGNGTVTNRRQTTTSSTVSRYTSSAATGTTLYTSTASTSFTRSEATYSGTDPDGTIRNTTTSSQTSAESETSQVFTLLTASIVTSTTTSRLADVFSTSTYEEEGSAWTTSSDEEASTVSFYTTETESSSTEVYLAGQVGVTEETTTRLTETQTYGAQATVVQANTMLASNADIIYVIDPPEDWSGYSVATDSATSGTRFTISPSFSTEQSPIEEGSITETQTAANEVVSSSISWSATRTTQSSRIMPFANSAGLGLISLPISTSETVGTGTTTTQSQLSFTVFPANTVTYDSVNSDFNVITTTSSVTSWTNLSRVVVPRRSGTLDFEATQSALASATRIITTVVAASASTSTSSSLNLGLSATQTTESASGVTASRNRNVYGPLQATTVSPGAGLLRSKFITTGAVLGESRGGWFTASGSFFLRVAAGGEGLRGRTIFPTAFNATTAFSDSVSYRFVSGTQTTTSSAVVGISGASLTTTFPTGQFPAVQGAASPLPNGMTVVDICQEAGAYKNAIGGETTSFSAGITSYSEGQSAEVSCWRPVTAVAPPVLRLERTPIYWTAQRNPSELPPGAPADF